MVDFPVTVITGTFGEIRWSRLAKERAGPSVPGNVPWIHVHGDTLAKARNAALEKVQTTYFIGLDADDELSGPQYIDAMATGSADIRACAVSYVRNGRRARPYVPRVAGHRHDCQAACLLEGNYVAIGACIRTEALRAVGGWQEWPVYEDWDAVLRMYLAGATVETIPDAVYVAHVNPQSRNRAPSMDVKNATHHAIVAATLKEAA